MLGQGRARGKGRTDVRLPGAEAKKVVRGRGQRLRGRASNQGLTPKIRKKAIGGPERERTAGQSAVSTINRKISS